MRETLVAAIFWIWISFAVVDVVAGFLGWLELRSHNDATLNRLSKVMFAGGQRSLVTIIGLSMFGMNLRAQPWYLAWGMWAVIYKAYATWGWLLYYRGVFSNGGWWSLFKRKKRDQA